MPAAPTPPILTVASLPEYDRWLSGLRDRRARARIADRLRRARDLGALGDHKSLGEGLSELRIAYGGYRLYFTRRGDTLILLLCGGDKDSQPRDIARARSLLAGLERDDDGQVP